MEYVIMVAMHQAKSFHPSVAYSIAKQTADYMAKAVLLPIL